LSDSFFTRVTFEIQFTSQVLPPSSENDCSKWAAFGVMSDQTYRVSIVLPFILLCVWVVVVPKDLVDAFSTARRYRPILIHFVSGCDDFIREGHFARHIRRMRMLYRSKKRLGEPHEVGFAELHHIAHLELQNGLGASALPNSSGGP
jgi:hypothetical protein